MAGSFNQFHRITEPAADSGVENRHRRASSAGTSENPVNEQVSGIADIRVDTERILELRIANSFRVVSDSQITFQNRNQNENAKLPLRRLELRRRFNKRVILPLSFPPNSFRPIVYDVK